MIEVENLVKRYGSHMAVDHLTFHIDKGKIYGFLGPNGAGKSTTMNIMTGYIAPTEGTVRINGFDITRDAEEAKKCIGYLPEIPPLYQDMTVGEYLEFAAELKKKIPARERKEQIREIMEMTMIADMEKRLIRNLSKGYKQRVGLAQAILGYPDVIILDEPTVGLDPKQIIEIRELIVRLKEKHTVILSSHILSEVQAVCDEILILSKGKLVASDTPEGLTGLMNGRVSLEVLIAGRKEQIKKALAAVPGIQAFHFEKSHEKDCEKLILETNAREDIRKELFFALAEEKLPILSLQRIEKSLEDIFLELTQDGEEAGAKKADQEAAVPSKEDTAESDATGTDMTEGGNENDSNL